MSKLRDVGGKRPGGQMIARIWRGAVRKEDANAYARYMQDTGVAGYTTTPGNRGVWMLRRDVGEKTEFLMFTLWDSVDAIKEFAGDDYEKAVFYPEDDRFLIPRCDLKPLPRRHIRVARDAARTGSQDSAEAMTKTPHASATRRRVPRSTRSLLA
jgi:heme-degrading monooxygenase HmoA